MGRGKNYNDEKIIRKVLSDGEIHLRKEYENTRRRVVILPYKEDIYFMAMNNLHEINRRAQLKTIPFSVEATVRKDELRFEYL